MRKRPALALTTFGLAFALALAGCGDEAAPGRSQEALARTAFEALGRGDPQALLDLMPRAQDLRRLAEARGTAVDRDLEGLASEGRARGREAFDAARASSQEVVDWQAATFGGLLPIPSAPAAFGEAVPATLAFKVLSNGAEAVFTLGRCFQAEDGWRVAGPLRLVENPHGGDEAPLDLMTDVALRHLAGRIGAFYLEHGRLPERLDELDAGAEAGAAPVPEPLDARGAPIAWRILEGGRWELRAPGADGVLDTPDDRVFTREDVASPHGHATER